MDPESHVGGKKDNEPDEHGPEVPHTENIPRTVGESHQLTLPTLQDWHVQSREPERCGWIYVTDDR